MNDSLTAAVIYYWEFLSKLKFQNSSKSVRINPLVRHFGKSQSKFPKSFQSPWEKNGSKKEVHLWKVSIGIPGSYNITAVFWLKILLDDAFCTRLKKAWRFLSLALSHENLQNFEERSHGLVHGILEYIQHGQPWAIEKQPVERGKRAVHFRCFFIKCSNRHATGDKTNSMKSLSACVSWFKRYIYEKF